VPRRSIGPAVIVDPFSAGTLYAAAFAEAGIPVVAVMSAPAVPPAFADSWRPDYFDDVLGHDAGEARLARRLRRLRPRCILPGVPSGVPLADRLAARLLPGQANDPETAAARLGPPGEPGIEELGIGEQGLRELDGAAGWAPGDGPEYAVDLFSYEGTHTVTDVCRYERADEGPRAGAYESMEWLPPDDPAVAGLAARARLHLDVTGFRCGAAHVRLATTGDGPRQLSLRACPHGGCQPAITRAATGDSQVHRAARYFAGRRDLPAGYALARPTLVAFLTGSSAGVVRNAEVFAALPRLPSHLFGRIRVRTGQRLELPADRPGITDLGFVVLSHRSRDRVLADYLAVREIERSLVVAHRRPARPRGRPAGCHGASGPLPG
jgi:hypothetical protein